MLKGCVETTFDFLHIHKYGTMKSSIEALGFSLYKTVQLLGGPDVAKSPPNRFENWFASLHQPFHPIYLPGN